VLHIFVNIYSINIYEDEKHINLIAFLDAELTPTITGEKI
jgi:hypothetical protein